MSDQCTEIRDDLLELQWSGELQEQVQRVLGHLQVCEACRNAAGEYASLRAAVAPVEQAEPHGGWARFEERLAGSIARRRRFRWPAAIAAGLLIALTAANVWLLVATRQAQNIPDTKIVGTTSASQIAPDMSKASVVKAFKTVSDVFEGRANWVMLSDQASDLGLINERQSGTDLLVLRLVVMRGKTAVSQVHIAVIPGATVRVTVPSAAGTQLQYVITTDAKNLQNVGVSLAVEDSTSADAGLGSMVTSLNMMYGKSTQAGRITTRQGTFDLSMTLERGSDAGV